MEEQKTPFFPKLLSKFTYPQKFLIICLFFGLSVALASFFFVRERQVALESIKNQLFFISHQKEVNKLIEKIIYHEIDVNKFLLGDKTIVEEIKSLQLDISKQFATLQILDEETQKNLTKSYGNNVSQSLRALSTKWETYSSHALEKPAEENIDHHYQLIKDLLLHGSQFTANSLLVLTSDIEIYYLALLAADLLPQAQIDVPQIMILNELLEKNTLSRDIAIKLASFSFVLTSNLNKSAMAYEILKETISPHAELNKLFSDYLSTSQALTNSIYEDVVQPAEILKLDTSITEDAAKTVALAFRLQYALDDLMEEKLNHRLQETSRVLLYTTSLIIVASLCGLLLGFFIMSQINRPLMALVAASKQLADGDLSIRVPVSVRDEVGQVGDAFNQMVESLQELIGRLQWTGIQLTTSTTEISAAAKQQESSIVEQEATTKEIAITAKEISTTAKDFAKTMNNVSTTAEQTASLASSGRDGLRQMEGTMSQMVEESKNIASKLAILSEKAAKITSIITTITKVADQTNLLSLNAAIEAEKAGEHGRSFLVIASEIRRLADQTANATLDIEKMVNEIVSAVSAGVMGVDKFSEVINNGVLQVSSVGGQLTKIIEQVQALTKNFDLVNQGMQSQTIGAEQINESISQLSETARQTTESILHFHKAIDELNNAAQEMQSTVSKIKR